MGEGQRLGTRHRQQKAIDAYVEQAGQIGLDREKDKAAKVVAMDRAGFVHFETAEAKVRHFNRIWRGDETRQYLCDIYAMGVPEDPCPVSLVGRVLREHALQTDPSWGPRDRTASLSAVAQLTKIFIPTQTAKVATLSLSAKVERPAEFDVEPEMQARAILPAGQVIAKPERSDPGDDEDEGEGGDDDE